MAKKLSMKEIQAAVEDAEEIIIRALRIPAVTPAGSASQMITDRHRIAFEIVLHELLDNEYDRDLDARG
jgi:hypothetical protein